VLANVSRVGNAAITAVAFALGDNTVIAGTAAGDISAWFKARLSEGDEQQAKVRAHVFENQGAAVTDLSASTRDRSFVSVGADGSVTLRHLTTARTLLTLPSQPVAAVAAAMTPKSDGLVVALADGTLARFSLANPHPETTVETLFGKVWYEGYPAPRSCGSRRGAPTTSSRS